MKIRKIDYRHFLCGGFLAGSLALTFTVYRSVLFRLGEAFANLWASLKIFWYFFIDVDHYVEPTVLQSQQLDLERYLPWGMDELVRKLQLLPQAFITKELFLAYCEVFFRGFLLFLTTAALIVCFLILLFHIWHSIALAPNNKYGRESRPLRIWKRTGARAFVAVRDWFLSFFHFVADHGFWWKLSLFVWIVNLNLAGILVDAFAWYFYFAVFADPSSIVTSQIFKLVLDLIVSFLSLPWIIWAVIGFLIFDLIRKSIGYRVLDHHEAENRAFLEELPIVIFLNGTMGSKKTTTMTDMALSYECMFRDKALELILQIDLMFPRFPWIIFEKNLLAAMRKKEIYSLASCRRWISRKEKAFRKDPRPHTIFGYDIYAEPVIYNNDLEVVEIWQALSDYACLYFIYTIESSLLISNYSVRTDSVLCHAGNFPLWDSDFFRRDPRMMEAMSRHAHILDFDVLRVARQVVEDNRLKGSFEFGVVLITEIDKERGNQKALEGLKKIAFETNQKNDGFNSSFMMGRHPATVMHYPFIRFICDAQRDEAWEAAGRQLSNELWIRDTSHSRLAMPFFVFYEMLYDFALGKFQEFYPQYRYDCADGHLLVRWFHSWVHWIVGYGERIHNRFGYMTAEMEMQVGMKEGAIQSVTYYLSKKKVYSRRFSTDCYRAFFESGSLRSGKGLPDYQEYQDTCATLDELHRQNSYFIRDMEGMQDDD